MIEFQIGDVLYNSRDKSIEFIIESLDEDYLIQNECYILVGNYGSSHFRKVDRFDDLQDSPCIILNGYFYKEVKNSKELEYLKVKRTKLPRKLKKKNRKLGILNLTATFIPRICTKHINITLGFNK